MKPNQKVFYLDIRDKIVEVEFSEYWDCPYNTAYVIRDKDSILVEIDKLFETKELAQEAIINNLKEDLTLSKRVLKKLTKKIEQKEQKLVDILSIPKHLLGK